MNRLHSLADDLLDGDALVASEQARLQLAYAVQHQVRQLPVLVRYIGEQPEQQNQRTRDEQTRADRHRLNVARDAAFIHQMKVDEARPRTSAEEEERDRDQ